MEYVKKYVLPALLICIIAVICVFLRTVPVSSLWKGYSALYVPSDTNPETVFSELYESGCENVISFYNQKTPYFNQFLPVTKTDSSSYLLRRESYFFDKDRTVMIYYIPDEYNKNASKAVSALIKKHNIDAGLDCKSGFPLVTPVVTILVFLCFLFFSKNKIVFASASVFMIFFSFILPFYTNAASVCLILYDIFLCQKIWKRKGSLYQAVSNILVLVIAFLSLCASFFASFVSGLLFILCATGSVLVLFIINNIENYRDSKLRFCPVLIIPADKIKIVNEFSRSKAFYSSIGILTLLILYFTSVNLFSLSNSNDLSFPMPTRYNTQNGIPNLDDYVLWTWNAVTMPYKSLNSSESVEPEKGETVNIPRYKISDDGITTFSEEVFCFNDDFKAEVIRNIDSLDYPALELMMKKQQEGFSVDYSYGSGEKFRIENVVVMLILFGLPFGILIYNMIGRQKYGVKN